MLLAARIFCDQLAHRVLSAVLTTKPIKVICRISEISAHVSDTLESGGQMTKRNESVSSETSAFAPGGARNSCYEFPPNNEPRLSTA